MVNLSLSDPIFTTVLGVFVALSTVFSIFLVTLPSAWTGEQDRSITTKAREEEAEKDGFHDVAKDLDLVRSKDGKFSPPRTSVQVIVLGDIGRSPRMQYHAISIASHGGRVDMIGYLESELHPKLANNPMINVVPLSPLPRCLKSSNKLLFLIIGPLKVLYHALSLYRAVGYNTKPAKWMLLQIPPSIPTLAVCAWTSLVRRTTLIIDWHNLAPSLLALKLGPSHPFVKLSTLHERLLARSASVNFTVSDALLRFLHREYRVSPASLHTLHDRAHDLFRPFPLGDLDSRAAFLRRLPETAGHADDLLRGKWRLLVSSTSWTHDEDFGLLLDALVSYSAASNSSNLPHLLVIITGKGPLKDYYLSRVAELNQQKKLSRVVISTAWLADVADYATLLAAADLGVSLHTSSSGLDLPMKVVDMFGAGLPVVGWGRFEAWPELVREDVNGRSFGSAQELAEILVRLFGGGGGKDKGKGESELEMLRRGARAEADRKWADEWDKVAGRVFGLVS